MDMILTSNADARAAFQRIADDLKLSLTALGESQGLPRGTLTRFVSQRATRPNSGKPRNADIQLSTFLRALDGVGYEVVVRPKTTASRRERRLQELRQRGQSRGREGEA